MWAHNTRWRALPWGGLERNVVIDMDGRNLGWDDRDQVTHSSSIARWNSDDSAQRAPSDALNEYVEGKGNLLDHLVPAQQRTENPLAAPAILYPDGEIALDSMRAACREAEESYCSRKQWSAEVMDGFNSAFTALIKERTPGPEDEEKRTQILEQLGRIVGVGLDGHNELHVEPYGSFVSGLYSPTGDLDISIEGFCGKEGRGRNVREMGKQAKAGLLRALSKKLERSRLCRGYIQRILHARVPILKFEWAQSGIPCDVSVGSANSRFKAQVVKALAQVDGRFGQLLRLVKAWSGAHGLNDAANGTFNTFALSLMVLFHLQLRRPAVLPPLHTLFRDRSDAVASRPLHLGQEIQAGVLEAFQREAEATPRSGNTETLAELLASFFARFAAATQQWLDSSDCCDVRASTWCGAWSYRPWAKAYLAGVEDPFDCSDNCARTIGRERLPFIARSFAAAADAMLSARDPRDVKKALAHLFGPLALANVPGALRPKEDSVERSSEHHRNHIQNGRTWHPADPDNWRQKLEDGTPQETKYLPNGAIHHETHGQAAMTFHERSKLPGYQVPYAAPFNSSIPGAALPNGVLSHDPANGPLHNSSSAQAALPKFVRQLPGNAGPAAVPQRPPHKGTPPNVGSPPSRSFQAPPGAERTSAHPPTTKAQPAPPAPASRFAPPAGGRGGYTPPSLRNQEAGSGARPQYTPLPTKGPGSSTATEYSPIPDSNIRQTEYSPIADPPQQQDGKTARRILKVRRGSSESQQQSAAASPSPSVSSHAQSPAIDQSGSATLRQMLNIGGGGGREAASSGDGGKNATRQHGGGGSLGLPDELDLGSLHLGAGRAGSNQSAPAQVADTRGAPAASTQQASKWPPKGQASNPGGRKAVPVAAAAPGSPASSAASAPHTGARRRAKAGAAAALSNAEAAGPPSNSASAASEGTEGAGRKPRPKYRAKRPAQGQPGVNKAADGSQPSSVPYYIGQPAFKGTFTPQRAVEVPYRPASSS